MPDMSLWQPMDKPKKAQLSPKSAEWMGYQQPLNNPIHIQLPWWGINVMTMYLMSVSYIYMTLSWPNDLCEP